MSTLTYDEVARRGGDAAMRQLGRFFMGDDPVHATLDKITSRLEELGVPYAIAGAMALNAHGFRRATLDVDMLVTSDGLKKIHQELEGLGYVAPFAGSKNLKDTETTVRIEFLVAGQYPGDGKPKPVPFPDPAAVGIEIDGVRYLNLTSLIELKLASGMSNVLRAKDIGDVVGLIKTLQLSADFADKLNPYVRERFTELAKAVEEAGNREDEF